MLRYLAEHPGRLVTKAELHQHVWAGMHVSDTVIRVCIREIRVALGDAAKASQYLQTVSGQGYRWLIQGDRDVSPPVVTEPIIVGRQHEVDVLEAWFRRAAGGDRQLVFLSGEAGVGKSTVLDLWLSRLTEKSEVWVARGQCSQYYGEGEPYLPLLDALGTLGSGPQGHELLSVLRHYAPMWLLQLPGLASVAELERVQRQVQGVTQARMIRELADALAALTVDTPLVLVLEDLHWSDNATVEFLNFLAQRREPMRLFVLGTYRVLETVINAHPLRGMVQELRGRRQCVELSLELLSTEEVAAYVAGRLGGPVTTGLTTFIHERTEGNALFMVNIVEHLLQQRLIIGQEGQWALQEGSEAKLASVPEELRQLLLRRIEELQPEVRQVLEAASVVGVVFAATEVAAGLQRPVEEVEGICEGLAAKQHFLSDMGLTVWPDGTMTGRYQFQHALYAQVLYEYLGSVRRMRLHRRIGVCLEADYGDQVGEIAAQLAVHFEHGGEALRAVRYLQQASDNAVRRNAHHEAITILSKGVALLRTLPDSPERMQDEMMLLLILGRRLMAARGYGVPEVGEVYTRAHTLCQQVGEPRQRCQALQGLYRFHLLRAQLSTANELIAQFFRLAPDQHDIILMQEGYTDLGLIAYYRGDQVAARAHLEHSLRLCDTPHPSTILFPHQYESGVRHGFYGMMVLWLLGYADQAEQWKQDFLARAQQVKHTPSQASAQLFASILSQLRRDVAATQAYAEATLDLAATQGFEHRTMQGCMMRGWALAMQGDAATGAAHIRQGLEAVQSRGQNLYHPYHLSLLAEAYVQAGQLEAGLATLGEALTLVQATDERWWEAELYRLQGELFLRRPRPDISQATACFHQALGVARRQQAKSLELRAALSLSRLWQQQGKRNQARQLLAEVYSWFTEGFETADLQEARSWLEALTE
jgi:tetratricopeptide (TPR) repeat protein